MVLARTHSASGCKCGRRAGRLGDCPEPVFLGVAKKLLMRGTARLAASLSKRSRSSLSSLDFLDMAALARRAELSRPLGLMGDMGIWNEGAEAFRRPILNVSESTEDEPTTGMQMIWSFAVGEAGVSTGYTYDLVGGGAWPRAWPIGVVCLAGLMGKLVVVRLKPPVRRAGSRMDVAGDQSSLKSVLLWSKGGGACVGKNCAFEWSLRRASSERMGMEPSFVSVAGMANFAKSIAFASSSRLTPPLIFGVPARGGGGQDGCDISVARALNSMVDSWPKPGKSASMACSLSAWGMPRNSANRVMSFKAGSDLCFASSNVRCEQLFGNFRLGTPLASCCWLTGGGWFDNFISMSVCALRICKSALTPSLRSCSIIFHAIFQVSSC
mmetsp:Transcript_28748/g.79170  ORF Transcript_28748/g.79170 Transcript_28748/m.79170 type:complete len:383 (-) Transcript_28748:710-1858(-)